MTINGIVDDQNEDTFVSPRVIRPSWLHPKAIVSIDYVDGHYWCGEREQDIADIHGAAFDPNAITGRGMRVDSSNTNRPNAIGDLFTDMKSLILSGCTIQLTCYRADGTGYLTTDAMFAVWSTDGDLDDAYDTENVSSINIRTSSTDGHHFAVDVYSNSDPDVLYENLSDSISDVGVDDQLVAPNDNIFAFTINGPRENNAVLHDEWWYHVCANGGTVYSFNFDRSIIDWFGIEQIMLFHIAEWGGDNPGEFYVRGFVIYPPHTETQLDFKSTTIPISPPNYTTYPYHAYEFGPVLFAGGASTAVWSDVVFQCSFDGADNATTATDESMYARAITFAGTAKLDTAFKKYGTASLELAAGARCTLVHEPVLCLNDLEFNVECYWRHTSGTGTIMGVWDESNTIAQRWRLAYNGSGVIRFQYYAISAGTLYTQSMTIPSFASGTQYHLAVTRDVAGNLRGFIGGVKKFQVRDTTIFPQDGINFSVGGDATTTMVQHIDEVRIVVRGVFYTTDFTPLSVEFPELLPPVLTASESNTVSSTQTLAHPLSADESVTFTISGGADAAQFEINTLTATTATLRWLSNGTQDIGTPLDANADNIYEVIVQAADVTSVPNLDTQAISITVVPYDGGAGDFITEDSDKLLLEDGDNIQRETS